MSSKRSTCYGEKCNQTLAFRQRALIDHGDKRKGKGDGERSHYSEVVKSVDKALRRAARAWQTWREKR